jgi:hypothetical protein
LPNAERLSIYAEVSLQTVAPDVLLFADEGDQTFDMHCGEFVVVGYQTVGNRADPDRSWQLGGALNWPGAWLWRGA